MKTIIPRFISLLDLPASVSENVRRQKLLNIIASVMGGIALFLIAWAVITWQIWPIGDYEALIAVVAACGIMTVGSIIILMLNRIGSGLLARILFVGLLFLPSFFDTASEIADGRALLIFSLSIIAAAILIHPAAGFVLGFISTVVVEIAAHTITPAPQPLPSIVVFFILAAFIWMATYSLEHHIKQLRKINVELTESEARYRAVIEISPDMVILTNLVGEIIVVNQAGLALFGFTDSSEVTGKKVFEFLAPQDQERAISEFSAMVQYESTAKVEYRAQTKQGNLFFLELSAAVLKDSNGQPQAVLSMGRDVTLHRKAEQSLQAQKDESQEAYRALVNNSAQGLVLLQNGRIILANKAIADCIGLTPEELYALPDYKIFEFVPPGDREIGLERNRDRLLGKPVPKRYETRLVHKNGTVHWLELMPSVITLNGIPTIQITAIEITERKLAEEAMRKSEERYRNLAETAQDIIVIVDLNDQLLYVNHYAAKLAHKTPEEMLGSPRSQYFSSETNDRHLQNLSKVAERGQPMFTESLTSFPTGEIWLSNWMVPIKDESGNTKEIMAISRNITEHKMLEKSLLDAKNLLEQRVAERTADLINSHEQMRRLTRRTVLAQENERRRLSRELHDETGQALIGLKFSLDEILAEIPEEQEKTRQKISKTLVKADELNQQIRNLAHGLRPPILDVAGIDLALNGFCREFSEETHFPVTYSGTNKLPILSEEVSITLYRIVQEAITNVFKHAHASDAHVSLRYAKDCITLIVKDNGKGFDTAKTSKGVGLLGMEERLGLLGGNLEILSRRNRGTQLKAVVPITRELAGL